jgi:hypothetical protein
MIRSVDRETGIVFFASAVVLLVVGLILVGGRQVSRRYLIYRVVPLSGFFGAFGLGILTNPGASLAAQIFFAGLQTLVVLVFLHLFIGRHLRG